MGTVLKIAAGIFLGLSALLVVWLGLGAMAAREAAREAQEEAARAARNMAEQLALSRPKPHVPKWVTVQEPLKPGQYCEQGHVRLEVGRGATASTAPLLEHGQPVACSFSGVIRQVDANASGAATQ